MLYFIIIFFETFSEAMKKLSALLFNQGGKCFYCDAILDIDEATIEHIVPKSKGGNDDLNNLVVCCKYANQAFRDYSPKHKMGVIKQLCCLNSICKKIFPRMEPKIEIQDFENAEQIEHEPDNTTKNTPTTNVNLQEKLDISVAYNLLLQVVKLFEDEGREPVSSKIKKRMLELEPSFNESNYGFSKFKNFLLHAQEEKIVILKQHKTASNYIVKKMA